MQDTKEPEGMSVIVVGEWRIGIDQPNDKVVMMLRFADRDPIALAMARDCATAVAAAIKQQDLLFPKKP